jgi:hypothetical protein
MMENGDFLSGILRRPFHFAHFAAAVSASPASLGAALHLFAADTFAGISAGLAHFGASGTFGRMQLGAATHEIGGGLAGLDAIGHEFHMLGLGMFSTHRQAVIIKRILADIAAFPALANAIFHMRVVFVMHKILHLFSVTHKK